MIRWLIRRFITFGVLIFLGMLVFILYVGILGAIYDPKEFSPRNEIGLDKLKDV